MAEARVDVRGALRRGRALLAASDTPALDAELLLGHALGRDRSWLYANPEAPVDGAARSTFDALLERRHAGEPVAYLVGIREFWSLPLRVTPDVLIPRPETELLVETALALRAPGGRCRVADLGTGCGAVALAIASERPDCEVHATEIDPAALAVARANAERLLPGRVRFHAGSWCAPLDGRFDLVVANPPYIAADDPHLGRGDCRFEPRAALTPGADALAAIRTIADEAVDVLEADGWLAFEHGFEQGAEARALLAERGYRAIATRSDLAGHERVTTGRPPAG